MSVGIRADAVVKQITLVVISAQSYLGNLQRLDLVSLAADGERKRIFGGDFRNPSLGNFRNPSLYIPPFQSDG